MTIIDLQQRRADREPHIAGTFKCGACRAEWVGVAPIGCAELQCPVCGCMRGYSKSHILAGEGSVIFVCKICEGELFSLAQSGEAQCAGCGAHHNPWA